MAAWRLVRRPPRLLLAVALVVLGAALAAVPVRAQQPAACVSQEGKLGLVLAGGGAKGFAHVGILRMLDSLGIVPDLVVGTSAGRWSARSMPAASPSTTSRPRRSVWAWTRSSGGTAPSSRRRSATGVPSSRGREGAQGFASRRASVREAPLNALMTSLYLRGNLIARGNFDRLPIPFRAVAADIHTRRQVVLGTGDLAQAVRASSSIPIVFRMVKIGGRDLVDGGIANNVPIEVARSLGATRLIISALLDTVVTDKGADDPLSVAAQMVSLLFEQTLPTVRPGDVMVVSDVNAVNQLDFSAENIRRVIAAGDKAAASLRDDQCLPRAEAPHRRGAADRDGGHASRNRADLARVLRVTLGEVGGRSTDVPVLQRRLQRLSQVERYRAVWLFPVQGPGDSVVFAAQGQASSVERQLAGAAFDRELGARLWVGRVKRFPRRNAEATEVVEIGQLQQELSVTLRRGYDVLRSPWSPLISSTIARTRVRDIRDGDEFPVTKTATGWWRQASNGDSAAASSWG